MIPLFPIVVEHVNNARIDFKTLVNGQFYDLNDVEQAFKDLDEGKVVGRAVVSIPH